MKTATKVLVLHAAVSLMLAAADKALIDMVMPGAKVVSGLNVTAAKASPFGQFLLSSMQKDDKSLQEMVNATGFDPRRDIFELVMISADPQLKGNGLILLLGKFDQERIAALAKTHNATATKYRGVDLFRMQGKQAEVSAFAIVSNSLAIAGDEASLKAALDRRSGAAPKAGADLVARINALSAKYDLWFFSDSPADSMIGRLPKPDVGANAKNAGMNALQSIQRTSGGIKLGANVQIGGEAVTRSPQDATALMNVINFVAGMVQMNRDKAQAAPFADALDSLDVKTKGAVMSMSLTVPYDKVQSMFQESQKMKPGKKPERI